jgi:hypothetical protein
VGQREEPEQEQEAAQDRRAGQSDVMIIEIIRLC